MTYAHIADCPDYDATIAAGASLGMLLEDGDVISLVGDLGAGKTSFSKGVGSALSVVETMASPTFNIVFQYDSGRIPLFHMDLYRLESPDALEDVGFYELTDSMTPGACLIEWADMFPEEMPDDVLKVRICKWTEAEGDESFGPGFEGSGRRIEASATGTRSTELLERWRSSHDRAI